MVGVVDQSAAVTSVSTGIVVTIGGGTHTKGAYVEMIASTSEETYWVTLVIKSVTSETVAQSFLVDFAVGAAASEVVKVANICFLSDVTAGSMRYLFPLTIASGSRVSLRCQSGATAVPDIECMVFLSNDDSLGTSTSNITMGVNTSASTGIDVDPGGTDNTKGAYSELESSTSIEVNYILVNINNSNNFSVSNEFNHLVDMSTGAASSEVVQIGDINIGFDQGEGTGGAAGFFQTIASGTRVAGRTQSSSTADANDRLIDMQVIGFNITAPAGGGGGVVKLAGQSGGLVG